LLNIPIVVHFPVSSGLVAWLNDRAGRRRGTDVSVILCGYPPDICLIIQ
jgi:hypothetical protein